MGRLGQLNISTTTPSTQAHGDAAVVGADGQAADALHKHAMPSAGSQIATGTYTGDGATSQAITGVGFQVLELLITARVTTPGDLNDGEHHWTQKRVIDDDGDGMSISLDNGSGVSQFISNRMLSLDSDGFSVGDGNQDKHPNKNTITYNWVAKG